jgi:hypothetical protein
MFTSLRVRGYRSIADSGIIPLGPITVLVGYNNAGKSALLRSVYHFQANGPQFSANDVRIGESKATAELWFDRLPPQVLESNTDKRLGIEGSIEWGSSEGTPSVIAKFEVDPEKPSGFSLFSSKEPSSVIIPVLAGRRVNYYREMATHELSLTVMPQDSNLVSRIMPLIGSSTPEGIKFTQLCRDILHVSLQVLPSENGNGQSFLGVQVDLQTSIPLESMGAGLSGALGLLVGLCQAKNKLFVIEEPEDDLHPVALKKLLDAILESSQHNQFLISTHNSIVLTRLGAVPDATVVHVTSDEGLPPLTKFEVKGSAEERMEILRDLGYGLADMSLGEGWLIFEEATAERLVYQWLAPWFAPGLLRLRHVSARGNTRAKALVTDFKEMFLFAHLEPMYRNRAWLILDGDQPSLDILEKLKGDFSDWPSSRFRHWSKGAIEYYFPGEFAREYADKIRHIADKRKRKEAKEHLFARLVAWIEEDHERAQSELRHSAREMIALLCEIESELSNL